MPEWQLIDGIENEVVWDFLQSLESANSEEDLCAHCRDEAEVIYKQRTYCEDCLIRYGYAEEALTATATNPVS